MSENGVESGKPLELPGASAPSTTAGSALVPDMTPEMVEKIVGSCGFKAATATIMGGGMGFLVGAFFGSSGLEHMRPDAPPISTWQQVKEGFKESGQRGVRMARGFAIAGGVYTACECTIQKKRGKVDIFNALLGGCAAGAVLAARGGPQAMAFGCGGFSLFSGVIEVFVEQR